MGPQTRTRLICFDVDGTLIEHAEDKTVWQVLNERFLASTELNRERFAAFRDGRLAYDDWVALDVGDWQRRGVRRAEIEQAIRESLSPVVDAAKTLEVLRERGYELVVVSGTISLTLELLLDGFRFDESFANRIDFDETGAICGWAATPFDVQGKARALEQIASERDLDLEEIAFVGDHWNDLAAMRAAGFAIAFLPKDEELFAVADVVIEQPRLARILEFFPGVKDG